MMPQWSDGRMAEETGERHTLYMERFAEQKADHFMHFVQMASWGVFRRGPNGRSLLDDRGTEERKVKINGWHQDVKN
jgi:hypothetical protein